LRQDSAIADLECTATVSAEKSFLFRVMSDGLTVAGQRSDGLECNPLPAHKFADGLGSKLCPPIMQPDKGLKRTGLRVHELMDDFSHGWGIWYGFDGVDVKEYIASAVTHIDCGQVKTVGGGAGHEADNPPPPLM